MILDILQKKRDKQKLSVKEIDQLLFKISENKIPDYQISALCMAIFLNGMEDDETINFTKGFVKYSDKFTWKGMEDKIIDKHSTGGVGDKVSLVVTPIWAALGLKVVKLSGKGLGFTGGTIDKLESIKGFKTSYSHNEFIDLINKWGMGVIQSNDKIVPVDKKMYAIRDVTQTVDSIPLIAASIISKKIVSGSKNLIIDLKAGSGSFCKDIKKAEKLAAIMIKIAHSFNINIKVIISNMNQPLGYAIGNAIEVKEAYDILQHQKPKEATEFLIDFAANGYLLTDKQLTLDQAKKQVRQVLVNGQALEKFKQWIKAQGGDFKQILQDDFTKAAYTKEVKAGKDGVISTFDVAGIGEVAKIIGAGRITKSDTIDNLAGIFSFYKIGDHVKKNDVVFKIQSSQEISEEAISRIKKTFTISQQNIAPQKHILRIL